MHSVPFRLLAVDELSLQSVGHVLDTAGQEQSDYAAVQPPGAVSEAGCEPIWASRTNASYPVELGLLLLPSQLFTLKKLRVAARPAQIPSQIEIFAPKHTIDPGETSARPGHDLVSRYLAAEWTRCCKPLTWEASESTTLVSPHQDTIRTADLNTRSCSFLKLVVHAWPGDTVRRPHQVVLEEIELSGGVVTPPSPHNLPPKAHGCKGFKSPAPNPPTQAGSQLPLPQDGGDDADYLETVLLEAGVSLDLVTQVVAFRQDISGVNPAVIYGETQKRISSQVSFSTDINELKPSEESLGVSLPTPETHPDEHCEVEDEDNGRQEEDDVSSPFDVALRQYVEQRARETTMLENALGVTISGRLAAENVEWQAPMTSLHDPANSNEVVLYTFGGFFTQCVLCGTPDAQEVCLRTAERYAEALKQAVGAVTAFEGLTALIVVALRGSQHDQVFQATMHLARTVFQTSLECVAEEPCPAQILEAPVEYRSASGSGSPVEPALANHSDALGLLEEVARANWSHGLQLVIEATLSNPRSWSLACNDLRGMENVSSRNVLASTMKRKSAVPPSIDRGFIRFVRMLLDQKLTRGVFFDVSAVNGGELHIAGSNGKFDPSTTFMTNQLRLIRLLLRSDIFRRKIPQRTMSKFRALCRGHLDRETCAGLFTTRKGFRKSDPNTILRRLASDCLEILSGAITVASENMEGKKNEQQILDIVHKNLQKQHAKQAHHSAVFLDEPLTEDEKVRCAHQFKRYFAVTPRPDALYHHRFTQPCQSSNDGTPLESRKWFQKGNIAFRGCIEAREPPLSSFHEQVAQQATPFVFDVDASSGHVPVAASQPHSDQQKIVASFATFRGTIEHRNSSTKGHSKIVPAANPNSLPILSVMSPRGIPVPESTWKDTACGPTSLTTPVPGTSSTADIDESAHAMDMPTTAMGCKNSPPDLPLAAKAPVNPEQQSEVPMQNLPPAVGQRKSKGKNSNKGGGKDPDSCAIQ